MTQKSVVGVSSLVLWPWDHFLNTTTPMLIATTTTVSKVMLFSCTDITIILILWCYVSQHRQQDFYEPKFYCPHVLADL